MVDQMGFSREGPGGDLAVLRSSDGNHIEAGIRP